jgi:hypothetical protein
MLGGGMPGRSKLHPATANRESIPPRMDGDFNLTACIGVSIFILAWSRWTLAELSASTEPTLKFYIQPKQAVDLPADGVRFSRCCHYPPVETNRQT